MKKLLLSLSVLMVMFSITSYALPGSSTTNKTSVQMALVSSATNGNTSFVTATSTAIGSSQFCSSFPTSNSSRFNIGGTLVNCGSTPITAIGVSGGASGGTVTIYDAVTNSTGGLMLTPSDVNVPEVGIQEVVFEATVGSNTYNYIDIHDAPIMTQNGIVASATSTAGVVIYTSKSISGNQ